jgi:hypothetical protein
VTSEATGDPAADRTPGAAHLKTTACLGGVSLERGVPVEEIHDYIREADNVVWVDVAQAEKLTAHEIDRGIAAVLDDLSVLRRDVLAAATDPVAEERDRSELRDRFARRFDQSLTDLQRMCDSLRNGAGS